MTRFLSLFRSVSLLLTVSVFSRCTMNPNSHYTTLEDEEAPRSGTHPYAMADAVPIQAYKMVFAAFSFFLFPFTSVGFQESPEYPQSQYPPQGDYYQPYGSSYGTYGEQRIIIVPQSPGLFHLFFVFSFFGVCRRGRRLYVCPAGLHIQLDPYRRHRHLPGQPRRPAPDEAAEAGPVGLCGFDGCDYSERALLLFLRERDCTTTW